MPHLSKIRKQKRIAYTIIGVSFILLLFANMLAWFYLQRIRGFFETDLAFRLKNIAQITVKLIDPADLGYIVPDDSSDPNIIYYQQLLAEIRRNNDLQDIYILSPAREVLVALPEEFGVPFSRHDLESDLIQEALGGKIVTSALQTLGEHKFMTTLAPVTDSNNKTAGVLVVEAPADFFDVLDQFNNGLIIFSGISLFVILIVAYLLWFAFRRLILIQEQMRDQEHLVRLGEMAASVAHEIRNPLSIINGAHSLIEKKYGRPDDEFFRYIPAELERLNKLIGDFLNFARTREPRMTGIDLNDLLSKIRLGTEERSGVDIQTNLAEHLPSFSTDAEMLEQILLNIISNSEQALQGKGKIVISVSAEPSELHISIADDGPGIRPEDMPRIFDPFFSTKDSGSGLGLAISRRLAGQIGGTLSVRSSPGQGTIVTLRLPVEKGSES
jgi:signal transduction histidine kinase